MCDCVIFSVQVVMRRERGGLILQILHFYCHTNPQILSFCTVQPPGFLWELLYIASRLKLTLIGAKANCEQMIWLSRFCCHLFSGLRQQIFNEPLFLFLLLPAQMYTCFGNYFFESTTYIHHIVSTHTVSRVDLICMWLTFVALVISSVNGHSRKAALKAYS